MTKSRGLGRGADGGRRSKLTPETRVAIARRLAAGDTMAAAAANAGVDERSLRRWLSAGRAAQDAVVGGKPLLPASRRYVELLEAIEEAQLELTEDTRQTIASFLATGADVAAAAAGAKVSGRALEQWLERGRGARERRDGGQPPGASDLVYLQLLADVEEARGAAEIKALATMQKSMLNGDWRAADRFLQLVFPEKYARRQGRPPGITPELRAELEALRAQAPAEPPDRLDALLARRAARST